MSQYLRPESDLTTTWTCSTGTSRYALIDEATASDTDYIYTSTKSAEQQMTLSNPAGTPGAGSLTLRIRAKGSTTTKIYPRLLCGSSLIYNEWITLTTSYTTYTVTISDNLQYITDWSDLRLLVKNGTVTGTTYCSWAELEVPDAAIPAGLEMGMMF